MQENPYAPPVYAADVVAERETIQQLHIASQGKRFLNLILDMVFIQILGFMLGVFIGVMIAILHMNQATEFDLTDERQTRPLEYLIGIGVAIGYRVFMEAIFQRTLAKYITGTMVVTEQGGRPTFLQILGRTLARFIPFEPFSLLGKNQPIGWHDSLSKTLVIDTRKSATASSV